MWNLLSSLAHGILKIQMVSSDIAFKSVIPYSDICSKAADWAHYSQLYSGLYPGWNNLSVTHMDHIYIRESVGVFFFFFSKLFQALTAGKAMYISFWFQGSVTFGQVPAVHVVFREPVPGTPVTWTGPGFARVLPGAGLRFTVSNVPFPMDFTVAIRYETQVRFKSNVFGGEKLNCILELSVSISVLL